MGAKGEPGNCSPPPLFEFLTKSKLKNLEEKEIYQVLIQKIKNISNLNTHYLTNTM
jgi:hypothetical protein